MSVQIGIANDEDETWAIAYEFDGQTGYFFLNGLKGLAKQHQPAVIKAIKAAFVFGHNVGLGLKEMELRKPS